jgi:hypothetical protein
MEKSCKFLYQNKTINLSKKKNEFPNARSLQLALKPSPLWRDMGECDRVEGQKSFLTDGSPVDC